MSADAEFDAWAAGKSYEHYMGRWSRMVAAQFLDWLGAPRNADWLEIGCGTGALTSSVLASQEPASIIATDASADFVTHTRTSIRDPRVRFETANAQQLPVASASVDVVTSGLVLNFVPDRIAGLREMLRILRPGGLLSFYVWDYPGGGIGFIDAFWKAAAAIDPGAADLDEGKRFPFCTESGLAKICEEAGVSEPTISPIQIVTEFPDFEAFWTPFTLGAGPAPGYCMSLPEDRRAELRARLAESLGSAGPIALTARAWAVKATAGG